MGKTSAERQAAFRARRKTELDAAGFVDARLETRVPARMKLALTRLARHKGVTVSEVLVELLTREEAHIRKGMSLAENQAYMGVLDS